jgi:tryptophanyl-tRNA synthetase
MRVISGIQPTGIPHLGNYFGALKKWVELQNEGNECFYFIANQHALTVNKDGEELKQNTIKLAASLLAIGLDPERSTIFIQSDLPIHSQFAWILSCIAPMGQMERMIQFKEKADKSQESATLGLFSYPVLQAADILLYKPELVPVGIDQAQHLELTRTLVKKFNSRYKEIFPEPKTLHTQTTKVVGLDGKSKMSKSYNNYISIIDDEKTLWKKLAPAVTDPARVKITDPGTPEICNIFSLHKLISPKKDIQWSREGCSKAKIGCIECKKKLFKNINILLEPIRDSYNSWMSKPEQVREILHQGGKKALSVAQETYKEVCELVGFNY